MDISTSRTTVAESTICDITVIEIVDRDDGRTRSDVRGSTHSSLYTCDVCSKVFKRNTYLKRHKLKHEGKKKYSCDTCGEQFITKARLSSHKPYSGLTNDKLHICDQCGKQYSSKGNLQQHQIIHSGQKPFQCETCDKCFISKQTYQEHLQRHNKEKSVQCDHCGHRYYSRRELNKHLLHHTTVSDFPCTACKMFFKDAVSLTRHNVKIHTQAYLCMKCGLQFTSRRLLRAHMAAMHEANATSRAKRPRHLLANFRKVLCKLCGLILSNKYRLQKHLHTKHQVSKRDMQDGDFAVDLENVDDISLDEDIDGNVDDATAEGTDVPDNEAESADELHYLDFEHINTVVITVKEGQEVETGEVGEDMTEDIPDSENIVDDVLDIEGECDVEMAVDIGDDFDNNENGAVDLALDNAVTDGDDGTSKDVKELLTAAGSVAVETENQEAAKMDVLDHETCPELIRQETESHSEGAMQSFDNSLNKTQVFRGNERNKVSEENYDKILDKPESEPTSANDSVPLKSEEDLKSTAGNTNDKRALLSSSVNDKTPSDKPAYHEGKLGNPDARNVTFAEHAPMSASGACTNKDYTGNTGLDTDIDEYSCYPTRTVASNIGTKTNICSKTNIDAYLTRSDLGTDRGALKNAIDMETYNADVVDTYPESFTSICNTAVISNIGTGSVETKPYTCTHIPESVVLSLGSEAHNSPQMKTTDSVSESAEPEIVLSNLARLLKAANCRETAQELYPDSAYRPESHSLIGQTEHSIVGTFRVAETSPEVEPSLAVRVITREDTDNGSVIIFGTDSAVEVASGPTDITEIPYVDEDVTKLTKDKPERSYEALKAVLEDTHEHKSKENVAVSESLDVGESILETAFDTTVQEIGFGTDCTVARGSVQFTSGVENVEVEFDDRGSFEDRGGVCSGFAKSTIDCDDGSTTLAQILPQTDSQQEFARFEHILKTRISKLRRFSQYEGFLDRIIKSLQYSRFRHRQKLKHQKSTK